MALSGARWPEEVDDLGSLDEVELRQCHDAIPVERRLEGEVEALEGFGRCQPGGGQRHAHAAILAAVELFRQKPVDGFDRTDLALFQALHHVVQHLHRARHLQPQKAGADVVHEPAHDAAPRKAAADGAVEVEWSASDADRRWRFRRSDWWGLSMRRIDMAAVLAVDHRVPGDHDAILKYLQFGHVMLDLERAAARGVPARNRGCRRPRSCPRA